MTLTVEAGQEDRKTIILSAFADNYLGDFKEEFEVQLGRAPNYRSIKRITKRTLFGAVWKDIEAAGFDHLLWLTNTQAEAFAEEVVRKHNLVMSSPWLMFVVLGTGRTTIATQGAADAVMLTLRFC
jgi:hypothetical protein